MNTLGEKLARERGYEEAMRERLPCGHPAACGGLAGPNGDQPGCGWCADISDNGMLIDHLMRTYDHFSGGRISKPLTLPEEIFAVANDLEQESAEAAIKEAREAIAAGLEAERDSIIGEAHLRALANRVRAGEWG